MEADIPVHLLHRLLVKTKTYENPRFTIDNEGGCLGLVRYRDERGYRYIRVILDIDLQTKTYQGPLQKQALLNEFAGKPLKALRTPAMIIDRSVFARNCASMHEKAMQWGAKFRAHLKTHKTAEGTRLQLVSSVDKTAAVVVSTLMEGWELIRAGLVADGTVNDILYGLPIGINKIADMSALRDEISTHGAVFRVLIDHPDQVRALEEFERQQSTPRRWSTFIKVDGGQKRAGIPPSSPFFESLLSTIFASPAVVLYGFYCHAGDSYASTSLAQASSFLSSEVDAVNSAAGLALAVLSGSPTYVPHEPFVLSVGSTPTAHAASLTTKTRLASLLNGSLELHAGNYAMLDLQQLHTGLIDRNQIAHRVLASVVSYYPGRGEGGADEAMCDSGAIAMSKDTGPSGGFGDVIGKPWRLQKISQEHGILAQLAPPKSGGSETYDKEQLELGSMVEIVGQHACLIAAAHPWFYIVDSSVANGGSDHVQDIWVPWKGW